MTIRCAVVFLFICGFLGCTGSAPRGKIVFQSNRDGNFEIYSMSDDGSDLRRLTNSASYDVSPSWSPDGTRILFASDRDGNWNIYLMKSDGTNVTSLTSHQESNSTPSWSTDGKRIVFVSTRDAVNGEIYMMNADGKEVQRLTQDSTVKDAPEMILDNSAVLFAANTREGSSIVLQRLSDKSRATLVPPSYNATQPRCSSDGHSILFAGEREGHAGIYSMTLADESVKRLTLTHDFFQTPNWMGSAGRIIYSKNGGLYVLSLDTQKEHMLSNKGDSNPHWVVH